MVFFFCMSVVACATPQRVGQGNSSSFNKANAIQYNFGLTNKIADLRFPQGGGLTPENPTFSEAQFSSWLSPNKPRFKDVLSLMDRGNIIYINVNSVEGIEPNVQKKYCNEIGQKVLRGFEAGGFRPDRFAISCRGDEQTLPGIDSKNKANNRVTFIVGSTDASYEVRVDKHIEKVKSDFEQKENVSIVIIGHVEVTEPFDIFDKDELKIIHGCAAFVKANEPIRYESKTLDLTTKKKDFSVLSIDANKDITKIECSLLVYDEDGFSRSEKETLIEFSDGLGGYIKELQEPPKGLEQFKSKIAPWLPLVPMFFKLFDLIDPDDKGDMISIELLNNRGFAPVVELVTEPGKDVKPVRLWFTVNVRNTKFENLAK
ncbi:hypothetical protein CH378_14645 [Leptospira kmetyi]|uniref:Lipoprotein LipL46 n=2 Tax=Leptospira kmetyi TaxID=408139 RepID=A0ABX4NCF0_9LEPT|nr:hypothetical protein CH378_14645 [Leptospira kmetyi]